MLSLSLNLYLSYYYKLRLMAQVKKTMNKYVKGFWIIFFSSIAGITLLFFLLAQGYIGFMPTFEELENPESILASEVISSDGKVLGPFFSDENRTYTRYDEISKELINALIATEDVRFFRHSGIDFRGLIRVFKGLVTGNSSTGGGSTISQQLAKMLFPREEFSNKFALIVRKFREWIIAIKLERSYTKEEILTMYLNMYDFLNNAVGIR